MNAVLALNDGTIIEGKGFGAEKEVAAEVVFNTSLVGYEEALTDPSYKGQILTLTFPQIGIYGVRKDNFESDSIKAEGFIVRDNSQAYQHRLATRNIDQFLKDYDIPGISQIDTRMLTTKLRVHGVMNGALITSKKQIDREYVLNLAKKQKDISELEFLSKVSTKHKKEFNVKGEQTIAIIDLGIKHSTIRYLNQRKINVIVMPYNVKAQEIMDLKANAILLSNGPGDPERATDAIRLVQNLQSELPIFGICLGHQIISLAMGAKTYKLKFGHRGSNHPVKNLEENKVYITSQNHSFAVDEASINGTEMVVDMVNLNDGSVEGAHSNKKTIRSVQFHPEASPGPLDCNNIFDNWIKLLKK